TTPSTRTEKLSATSKVSATSQSRTLLYVRKARAHRSKLPRQTRAIQEEISTGKRATSVEDGNSTDGKDKAGRTIAALSTKSELTKPNGPTKHGQTDTGGRNSSAEDRKPARSKDTNLVDGKGTKDAPVHVKARGTIAALST